MDKLKQVVLEQLADDTPSAAPERTGTGREHGSTVPLNEERASYYEPGFAAVEDELSPQEAHTDREQQQAQVRAVIESLPQFEQEVFYHVFGQGLSVRQTQAEMRAPSHMRVQRAVDTVKLAVATALVVALTGEQES